MRLPDLASANVAPVRSLGSFSALRQPAARVDVRLLELTVTCRAQLPGGDLPVMVLVTKESGWHSLLDPGKMHPPGVCEMPRVQGATAAGGESQRCADDPKANLQHWVADGGRSQETECTCPGG